MTRCTRYRPRIYAGFAVKTLFMPGVAIVANIGNLTGANARFRIGRLADVMLLMATGANRRFSVAAFHFMKVPRVNVSLNVSLVALGANIDDLLLVLRFSHDLFFRFEVGIMTGRADWIIAIIFLVLLEMVALLVFGSLLRVTPLANDFHA